MVERIESQVGRLLLQHGHTLSAAESCTGGLLCDRITNVPGSSTYFLGGIIAYSHQAKVALLGVSLKTLEKHGAVSREVVLEMARGCRNTLRSDLAVSISGIAGPAGGSLEKPVGTTWIGLSTPDGEWARSFSWKGSRRKNKAHSAEAALLLLQDYYGERLESQD